MTQEQQSCFRHDDDAMCDVCEMKNKKVASLLLSITSTPSTVAVEPD